MKVVGRCIYGGILLLIGGALALGGAKLLSLGGSPYYLPAGAAAAAVGLVVIIGRWRLGALIYLVLLAATLAWALAEVGLNGWALSPRVLSPAILGLPFLVVALIKGPRLDRLLALIPVGAAIVLTVLLFDAARYRPARHLAPEARPLASAVDSEWRYFGGSAGGGRHSALSQITPENVARLKMVWTQPIGPMPSAPVMQNQSVPLMVGGNLYTCTPWNHVLNLDPETGKVRWRFDPKVDRTGIPITRCRGLAYYELPGAEGACTKRIYTATLDARLIAIDALTGRSCPSFGVGGQVDLLKGLRQRSKGYYTVTSPPTLVRGKLVVGGKVSDGQYVGEPSGVIRAFDAVTGKLAWAWDMGRPGRSEEPADVYTPGTPNAWAPMSADEALGLVYAPIGNGTPDYWGGHRSAESNRYGSSVVALDAETGLIRWYFQTTHYDVWDYDVASQPVLFDLQTSRGAVPALLQPTKRGQLFVLDRRTGRPIFPVVEKPAPQEGALEPLWPTQPWSTAMPDLAGPDLAESSMWGVSALDQLWCRIRFRETRYAGQFTPPNLEPSLVYPGYVGGSNWGSASIDPVRQLALLPSNRMANRIRLLRRSDPIAKALGPDPSRAMGGAVPQEGVPYAVDVAFFLSPLFTPCQAPPYGLISAVDLRTGKMVWSRPLGSGRDLGPLGQASRVTFTMGVPTTGGALTTASGLVFIGASSDHALRAFDSRTGRLLFTADLPGSAGSTPIAYVSSRSGRQFIVVGSEDRSAKGPGYTGAITAFALPTR